MNRIRHIDGLRGVFALAVAVMHLNKQLIVPGAYLAVDFFFVLSGFILSYVYLPRINQMTHFDFIRARLSRLWPLHMATLLFYVIINSATYYAMNGGFRLHPNWKGNDFSSFFENVFLIHNIGFQETLTWNYPSWSISVEFWVNVFLFAVLAALLKSDLRSKMVIWLVAIVFFCYVMLEVNLPHLGSKVGIISQFGYVFNAGLLRGFGGIFLGVLVYLLTARMDARRTIAPIPNVIKNILEVLLISIVFYFIFVQYNKETDITAVFVFALLLTSLSIGQKTILAHILSIKPLTYLGMISYSIYLCHAPILQFFKRWELFFGDGFSDWTVAVIFTVVTILISTFAYYLIEKPGKNVFLKFWDSAFKREAKIS